MPNVHFTDGKVHLLMDKGPALGLDCKTIVFIAPAAHCIERLLRSRQRAGCAVRLILIFSTPLREGLERTTFKF